MEHRNSGADAKHWYDIEFEPTQLELAHDSAWLAQLAGRDFDENDIETANRYVASGSIDLRSETDPETIQGVLAARERFFGEFLGWDTTDHPLHGAYQKFEEHQITRMPLATVIQTQRVLAKEHLDAVKIITALPAALGYAPEAVRTKVDNLNELGLDAAKVITALPTALSLNPESVRAKVDNLNELGLDAVKVITTLPATLGLNPESVRTKLYALMKADLINDDHSFPHDEAFTKNFFILPTESLLLYLADHPTTSPADLPKLPRQARTYVKQQGGGTAPARKALYEREFDNPQSRLRQNLGYVALLNAMRLKLDSAKPASLTPQSAL